MASMDHRTPQTNDCVQFKHEDAPAKSNPFWARTSMPQLMPEITGALIHTAAVQRLRNVSFLGAIDHSSFRPKAAGQHLTSRFDHSVGVAALADYAARKLDLGERDRHVSVAAALLHDIGHGPLSHSLERSFEEAFGINHHIVTEQLLNGTSEVAHELRSALAKFDVDPREVAALMEGKSTHPMNWLFGGPINLDTVEGILRTVKYLPRTKITLKPEGVIDAALSVMKRDDRADESVRVVDQFWVTKGLMYTQVVRGQVGVISDYKCQVYFDRNQHRFHAEIFRWTDAEVDKKFPELFESLRSERGHDWSETASWRATVIPFIRRHFFLCHANPSLPAEEFFRKRYRQSKVVDHLTIQAPEHEQKGFFDEPAGDA